MKYVHCLALSVTALLAVFACRVATAEVRLPCENPIGQALYGDRGNTSSQEIQIGEGSGRISATFTRPENYSSRYVVLMLHGFRGSRNELPISGAGQGMFEYTAEQLAAMGIPSLRLDFRGSGESGGDWRNTTLDGQAQDVVTAIRLLRRKLGFRRSGVVLLGFSQGGLVALRSSRLGADISAMVLWNPVLDPRRTYAGILGEAAIKTGWTMAEYGRADDLVAGTGLNAEFFWQMMEAKPIVEGRRFRGPILVVAGQRDRVAASGPEMAALLSKSRPRKRTDVIVLDADHGFNARSGTNMVNLAISCSVEFISNL